MANTACSTCTQSACRANPAYDMETSDHVLARDPVLRRRLGLCRTEQAGYRALRSLHIEAPSRSAAAWARWCRAAGDIPAGTLVQLDSEGNAYRIPSIAPAPAPEPAPHQVTVTIEGPHASGKTTVRRMLLGAIEGTGWRIEGSVYEHPEKELLTLVGDGVPQRVPRIPGAYCPFGTTTGRLSSRPGLSSIDWAEIELRALATMDPHRLACVWNNQSFEWNLANRADDIFTHEDFGKLLAEWDARPIGEGPSTDIQAWKADVECPMSAGMKEELRCVRAAKKRALYLAAYGGNPMPTSLGFLGTVLADVRSWKSDEEAPCPGWTPKDSQAPGDTLSWNTWTADGVRFVALEPADWQLYGGVTFAAAGVAPNIEFGIAWRAPGDEDTSKGEDIASSRVSGEDEVSLDAVAPGEAVTLRSLVRLLRRWTKTPPADLAQVSWLDDVNLNCFLAKLSKVAGVAWEERMYCAGTLGLDPHDFDPWYVAPAKKVDEDSTTTEATQLMSPIELTIVGNALQGYNASWPVGFTVRNDGRISLGGNDGEITERVYDLLADDDVAQRYRGHITVEALERISRWRDGCLRSSGSIITLDLDKATTRITRGRGLLDAARLCEVSVTVLRRHMDKLGLTVWRYGGQYRFNAADLATLQISIDAEKPPAKRQG